MNHSRSLPRTFLWIPGIVLLSAAVVTMRSDSTIDLHFADTYYIFSFSYACMMFGFLLVVLWMIYRLLKTRILVPFLTWAHIIVSLVSMLMILSLPLMHDETDDLAVYLNNGVESSFLSALSVAWIAVRTLLVAQTLLLVNILISVFRKTGAQ